MIPHAHLEAPNVFRHTTRPAHRTQGVGCGSGTRNKEKGLPLGRAALLGPRPPCEAIRQREGRERLLNSSAPCLNDRRLAFSHWSFADASSDANGKNNRTNCNQELFHDVPPV